MYQIRVSGILCLELTFVEGSKEEVQRPSNNNIVEKVRVECYQYNGVAHTCKGNNQNFISCQD